MRNSQQEKWVQGLSGEGAGRQGSLDSELIRNVGLQVSDQANCLLLIVLLQLGREDFDTILVDKGDFVENGWVFFIVCKGRILLLHFCSEEDDVTENFPPTFSQAIIL